MDKDDFDKRSEQYVADGIRNVENAGLIENWCSHIEITRSSGRGLLEEMTGVPIGHMGVTCQHSNGGSMQSWDIRDSFVNFYENNCAKCSFRNIKNIPNAQPIIDEYISRKKANQTAREEAEQKANSERLDRKKVRKGLLNDNPNVTAIVSALNHLDAGTENTKGVPPKDELIELAKLASDVWTAEIIEHLFQTSLSDVPHKLKSTCAQLLLILHASKEQKARSCFSVLDIGASDSLAEWASENIELATDSEIQDIILGAIYRASRSYGISMGSRRSHSDLLFAIANKFPKSIKVFLKESYDTNDGHGATTAARAITVLAEFYPEIIKPHLREVCAWYLRWRTRDESLYRLKDSEVPHLLDAVVSAFQAFPNETDKLLQGFMEGLNNSRKADVDRIYQHAIRGKGFHDTDYPEVTEYEQIAFKRLLWRAIEVVKLESYDLKGAANYFSNPEYINPQLAIEIQDLILGAASALEKGKKEIESEPLIKEIDPFLSELNKGHIIQSITSLREGLIGLAFRAAIENKDSFDDILKFFKDIPKNDSYLQAAFISQLHLLAPTANELNLVLPIYYEAFYSRHSLVRSSACDSIWKLKYSLVRDLPSLMFETLLLQITDSFVIVHRSAVRSIKPHLLPNEFRPQLKKNLRSLFLCYLNEDEDPEFIKELSNKLLPMLTSDEITAGYGKTILRYAEKQSDMHRAKFAEDFTYKLRHISGMIPFHIAQIRSDWSLQVSNDRLIDILYRIETELLHPSKEALLKVAIEECRDKTHDTYKWVRLLSTKGMFDGAEKLASDVLDNIPEEKRSKSLRAWILLIKTACTFECKVHNQNCSNEEITQWNAVLQEYLTLETEKHERRLPIFF